MASLVPVAVGLVVGGVKSLLGGVFGPPKASGAAAAFSGVPNYEKAQQAAALAAAKSDQSLLGQLSASAQTAAAAAAAAQAAARTEKMHQLLPVVLGALVLGGVMIYARRRKQ